MTGSAPLQRAHDDSRVDLQPAPEPAQLVTGTAPATNPAHDLLAKLTNALGGEHSDDESPEVRLEGEFERWPLHKSAAVLLAGCGAFWLLAYVAVTSLV
jgi:hypothetical protein